MNAVAGRRRDLSAYLAMASRCHSGRKRDHNEDRVAIDPVTGLALVADGMGGHNAGEVASRLAVENVIEMISSGIGDLEDINADHDGHHSAEGCLLKRAIERSNKAIEEAARDQKKLEGMGTTIVAAWFHDDTVSIGSVGDSRLYRLRAGVLEQLTRDHTLLQELVDRGFYTPEEARASLNRNIVTRALGVDEDVNVDLIEDIVLKDDRYLLCSDGLNDMVADDDLRSILSRATDDLEQIADALIDNANENGGQDNISATVVEIRHSFPARRSWFRRLVNLFQ